MGFKGVLWGSEKVLRVSLGSLVGSWSYEALSVYKVVLESLRGPVGFMRAHEFLQDPRGTHMDL